ncbi:MAG: flagellar hook-length control protein FliK, partial [Planctomycetota bacterium]
GRNPGISTESPASQPAQTQTGASQTETDGGSESPGRPLADSSQILSQTAAQTAAAEQAPIFAVETEPATSSEQPQTTPGDPLAAVGNQVLESVRSSLSQQTGDKEITIQLNPPELGKVSVKFQQQGAEITGTLEVSKAQTRTEIEQVLPEIIRSLADSGVAIKRIEVVLSQDEESDQHGSRDPLLQDSAFGQRDSANPGQSGDEQQTTQTYYGPTGRSACQYQNAADLHDMLVTNTSIDMLV